MELAFLQSEISVLSPSIRAKKKQENRLPTRQMGWPPLGCNQQDPRRASERLVNCKPARTVPKVAGGRVANTAHHIN